MVALEFNFQVKDEDQIEMEEKDNECQMLVERDQFEILEHENA